MLKYKSFFLVLTELCNLIVSISVWAGNKKSSNSECNFSAKYITLCHYWNNWM